MLCGGMFAGKTVLPGLSALENAKYLKALYKCPGLLYFTYMQMT